MTSSTTPIAPAPISLAHRAARGTDVARIAVAGLNAWLVIALLPTLHAISDDAGRLALTVGPLVVLALGLGLLAWRARYASWVLLAAFPPALGAAVALPSAATARDTHGALTLGFGAIALLAFLAAAADAASRARTTHPATTHPIVTKPPVVEPLARQWLRRTLLGLSTLGALAIAVIAPARPDHAARVAAFGEAAAEGSVLVAVIAAIAGAVALAVVVGPSLRAERRTAEPPTRRRRAVLVALALAGAAALSWAVLTWLDAVGIAGPGS